MSGKAEFRLEANDGYLSLSSMTLVQDSGGGLVLRGEGYRVRLGRSVAQRMSAPVALAIRIDGYGLLQMMRTALNSKGRKCKDGPIRVEVARPTWVDVAPVQGPQLPAGKALGTCGRCGGPGAAGAAGLCAECDELPEPPEEPGS
jgi:hypothetical protein